MRNRLLEDISTPIISTVPTSAHVMYGIPVLAVQRIKLLSPDDWEIFVQEWAHSLEPKYRCVKRFAGSGDHGRDVVGFYGDDKYEGDWDLYQCKRYQDKLSPSDIWIELGKLIYYTNQDKIKPPKKFCFMAPQGITLKLEKILVDKEKIKNGLKENWDTHCRDKITTAPIELENNLLVFFENFDFSIFSSMTAPDLVEGHAKTSFHATRFGGGLPPISKDVKVPEQIQEMESRYITQLFEAYSDNTKQTLATADHLESHEEIKGHFSRSRESFYSAESLRNFARDNVLPGTFESLQDEVFNGVIDICEHDHTDGFARLKSTTNKATELPLTNNPLHSTISINHRKGICHQLSNDDKLTWVKKK